MRIRSVLAAGALALAAIVLPATTAHAAAPIPAERCALRGSTLGIFIQATGGTLCLEYPGHGSYRVPNAYGCGPLSRGGGGYVTTANGTRISCNGWRNFAHTTVRFRVF